MKMLRVTVWMCALSMVIAGCGTSKQQKNQVAVQAEQSGAQPGDTNTTESSLPFVGDWLIDTKATLAALPEDTPASFIDMLQSMKLVVGFTADHELTMTVSLRGHQEHNPGTFTVVDAADNAEHTSYTVRFVHQKFPDQGDDAADEPPDNSTENVDVNTVVITMMGPDQLQIAPVKKHGQTDEDVARDTIRFQRASQQQVQNYLQPPASEDAAPKTIAPPSQKPRTASDLVGVWVLDSQQSLARLSDEDIAHLAIVDGGQMSPMHARQMLQTFYGSVKMGLVFDDDRSGTRWVSSRGDIDKGGIRYRVERADGNQLTVHVTNEEDVPSDADKEGADNDESADHGGTITALFVRDDLMALRHIREDKTAKDGARLSSPPLVFRRIEPAQLADYKKGTLDLSSPDED